MLAWQIGLDPRARLAAQNFGVYAARICLRGNAYHALAGALERSVLSPQEAGLSPERHAQLLTEVVLGWVDKEQSGQVLMDMKQIRDDTLQEMRELGYTWQ